MIRLLAFARELQHARNFGDLIEIAGNEVREALGYNHVFMYVAEDETATVFRLLEYSGKDRALVWENTPVMDASGDAMVQETVRSDHPVVIEDARTDPRTDKKMVELYGNRTMINVPLRLLDKPLGTLVLGTLRDEGVRVPTPAQLEYLVGMASQLVVAAGRIRFLAERDREAREKAEHERRLLQAQRLESLGLLAGGVAHDFNNLLTVILASASMLRDVVPEGEPANDLEAMAAAAKRGRDLASQLLAVGRAQALEPHPFDLNQRIDDLVRLLQRVLPAGIAVKVKAAPGLPQVSGDFSQIDQLLMNLCLNARDAMPGGGSLTIETSTVDLGPTDVQDQPWARAGSYDVVTVTDSGDGMTAEVRERIFEPFFSTKPRTKNAGTGIGLAVAYGIVRQHRGLLRCQSEPGIGTTFSVFLPQGSPVPDGPTAHPRPTLPTKGGERILFADDDADVRLSVGRVLAASGYRVQLAVDGVEAVERARQDLFDLAILDVAMPRLGGPDALRQIRADHPHVRVLLSSAYLDEAAGIAVREARPEGLLQKPFEPEALLGRIRELLDRP